MKYLSILLIFLSAFNSIAQENNLLENGSFESTKGKVKGLNGIETANGWISPSKNKADLFVADSKDPNCLTSGNKYGKEDPKKGENYAGIVGYSYGDKMPRTYLTSQLKVPMQKGVKYCISMYISLSELSKYACNQIGFQFSAKSPSQEDNNAIIGPSHVLHSQSKIVNATYGWEKICGVYVAEGGEKFVTIGNFTANDGTKFEKTLKNKFKGIPVIAAYYFVDEVKVSQIDTKTPCDCGISQNNPSDAFYHKVIVMEDHMDDMQRIEAHTTFFPFGQFRLQEANKATIDVVVKLLNNNPEFNIELFGHIDSLEQVNAIKKPAFADLSHKRIRAVMEYMIEQGIDKSRFIATPTDEVEPNEEILAEDDEHLKNAKNRRVMFKVIQKPKQ
jgi:outer membrane protein OmpA-like peptidoglycan-associated protein